MRIVVHKYEVGPFGQVEAPLIPRFPVFMHVAAIEEKVFVWARVDLDMKVRPWRIGWFTTGQEVPASWIPVGSFIVPDALGEGRPSEGHVFHGGYIDVEEVTAPGSIEVWT